MKSRTLLVLLALLLLPPVWASAARVDPTIASPVPLDVAVAGSGPIAIVGEVASASALVSPDLVPEPAVVLMDVGHLTLGRGPAFVPDQGQILGYLTTPIFPGPGTFRVDLPIQPRGSTVTSGDGVPHTGVQVFGLIVSSNLTGDSYLQQLEQFGGFTSYLTDAQTGLVTEGSFLLFAEHDDAAFPTGFGADGLWFTSDDPLGLLPPGYTVASLSSGGAVDFDRQPEATMNTIEAAEQASPDFSDQGMVESFHSLIDTLRDRYAYTELRGVDWEAVRSTYLPAIEAAERDQDLEAYYFTLQTLARSIGDAHVDVGTNNFDLAFADNPAFASFAANVGASVIAVSDPDAPDGPPGDTIVVLTVGSDTPAGRAGWIPGTVIHRIDGKPIADRYAEIPLFDSSTGTEAAARAQKTRWLLSFAEGQQVAIDYSPPGSSEVMSVVLEAGFYDKGLPAPNLDFNPLPITLTSGDPHTVVRWTDFVRGVQTKLAVLEEAVSHEQFDSDPGLILDLRGNGGGWEELYEVMASYFFTADEPLPLGLFDWYHYDADEGGLVQDQTLDLTISSPDPDTAFTGPLVILIDEQCVSACEYFTQTLQLMDRAVVVGQHATAGGGGNIDIIALPGEIMFQYTVGRSTFAGSAEFNIEAKGVTPDVRVPVTLDTELAKIEGRDPVLQAGIAEIDREVEVMAATQVAEVFARATARAEATPLLGTPTPEEPAAGTAGP